MVTRFRAYQLGTKGSSFSYFANGRFTVIEGRLNAINRKTLLAEMEICGVTHADDLHVTSWDADHCAGSELESLLGLVRPSRIDCPGYVPHTVNGDTCLDIIEAYRHEMRFSNRGASVRQITPAFIANRDYARDLAFQDTYHNPVHLSAGCDNDNSTVKHFRRGDFNVLSLGDVESTFIGARLTYVHHALSHLAAMADHPYEEAVTNLVRGAALEARFLVEERERHRREMDAWRAGFEHGFLRPYQRACVDLIVDAEAVKAARPAIGKPLSRRARRRNRRRVRAARLALGRQCHQPIRWVWPGMQGEA